MESSASALRIFYLEDNPLIVFHIEAMIEDLGMSLQAPPAASPIWLAG
jgi:hypothetical protein|nr:hypothetical protein [Ensifer sp. Root31]